MPLGRAVVPLVGLLALAGACTPQRYGSALAGVDANTRAALGARAAAKCAAAPSHPFTSDGCSAWPDGDWGRCCVEHDMAYWCGGDARLREAADRALRACVAGQGHATVAAFMYYGVRVGGHPLLPFPWRWGYGWNWPYRY